MKSKPKTEMALLQLVADIRAAVGDPTGKLMQDQLVEHCRKLKADSDALMSAKPIRIQRRRVKGWRMPPNTVSVCRPGKWGNPFNVADVIDSYGGDSNKAAADCVSSYRRWIEEEANYQGDDAAPSIELIRRELRGKNLACFCPLGSPCHADVLLEWANNPETEPTT